MTYDIKLPKTSSGLGYGASVAFHNLPTAILQGYVWNIEFWNSTPLKIIILILFGYFDREVGYFVLNLEMFYRRFQAVDSPQLGNFLYVRS